MGSVVSKVAVAEISKVILLVTGAVISKAAGAEISKVILLVAGAEMSKVILLVAGAEMSKVILLVTGAEISKVAGEPRRAGGPERWPRVEPALGERALRLLPPLVAKGCGRGVAGVAAKPLF
jgi:hypothetical protein